HFHEPEAARPAGLPVRHDLRARHVAMLLEQSQQIVGRCIPDEVADVDILRHLKTFPCPARRGRPKRREPPDHHWMIAGAAPRTGRPGLPGSVRGAQPKKPPETPRSALLGALRIRSTLRGRRQDVWAG